MTGEEFYKKELLRMITAIHDEETLNSIYSFTKVFADDKEKGKKHEGQ